jgi:hypothetical protein
MSVYTKAFVGLLGLIVLFAVVLPYLISARSNELTTLGILLIVGLGYATGKQVYKLTTGDTK